MNFFKKLFSGKKETAPVASENAGTNFGGIYTPEYFDQRYSVTEIEAGTLEGCFKMIEGYLMDNQLEKRVSTPVNHPLNLDQVDQDGFGFLLYCKALQLTEQHATFFLAYAFSDFLITKYGFKLYSDSQPEYPLRGMTLKYERNGGVLSLYPFEYASKVLNGNETFAEMEEKLSAQLETVPNLKADLDRFMNPGSKVE